MEARERRPQLKPERELPVDIDIDKEKLKKAFDLSHFDINAVLRGVELTLVGGRRADLDFFILIHPSRRPWH